MMKKTIATPIGLNIPYIFTSQLPPKREDESISEFNGRKSVFNAAKSRAEQKEVDRLTELAKYGDKELTAQEITGRENEEAKSLADKIISDQLNIHKQALAGKWKDPFELIDDILERGIEVVKTERDAIKAANPKPEELS